MISELPIEEFDLATLEGLEKVFKDFATVFNKSHGAAHQIKLIHHYANAANSVIKGVEVPTGIRNAFDHNIGKRIYDAVIEIGGREYLYDSKAWATKYIRERLFKSIKGEPIDGETPGQLFKDIVHMYRNPDVKIRWAFDSRSAGKAKEITGWVKEAIEKNEDSIAKSLRVNINNTEELKAFYARIDKILKDFIEVVPE
jgi:hypothetical protein